jgi:predicted RNase H-like HicB family nuclease
MTKYEIILYRSTEDDAFIAEVPELAGCSADGATRQEALANVELVIAEWLKTPGNLVAPFPSRREDSCSRKPVAVFHRTRSRRSESSVADCARLRQRPTFSLESPGTSRGRLFLRGVSFVSARPISR